MTSHFRLKYQPSNHHSRKVSLEPVLNQTSQYENNDPSTNVMPVSAEIQVIESELEQIVRDGQTQTGSDYVQPDVVLIDREPLSEKSSADVQEHVERKPILSPLSVTKTKSVADPAVAEKVANQLATFLLNDVTSKSVQN